MQGESDSESEDCGIPLVPVAVSKSRGVEYRLRKENSFLSELRKQYEVNMLVVKKELLDEKIHKKVVEEAVKKGRHRWQEEKGSLEKELTETREKVVELRGKLKLQEEKMQELNSRARSPSVMPKEERVAAVDAMMEVVGVRNELAATARFQKKLIEENGELMKTINDLMEENTAMKNEIERLQSQVFSNVLVNVEGRGEVNEKQKDELRKENRRKERGDLEDSILKEGKKEKQKEKGRYETSKKHRRDDGKEDVPKKQKENRRTERGDSEDAISKKETKEKQKGEGRGETPKKRRREDGKSDATPKKRREDSEKLAALEEARIKVWQARDPREISRILSRFNAKKVASVAKGFPSWDLRIASDKESALKPLDVNKVMKMEVAADARLERRVYFRNF